MNRKTNIKEIKIGYKCHKKWSTLENNISNKHCNSCQKLVYDFEQLTTEEIIEFLENRKGKNTCGKFGANQLSSINSALSTSNLNKYKTSFFSTLILSTALACSSSIRIDTNHFDSLVPHYEIIDQHFKADTLNTMFIKGTIVDQYNNPIIGANIGLEGTPNFTNSDLDGRFELSASTDTIAKMSLTASYVGFEKMNIKLVDIKNKEIKIVMPFEPILLGDVCVRLPLHIRIWDGLKRLFLK